MNMKTIETNWTELKGKIKAKWGKFSNDELESFKGDLNLIAGKIQTTYGIAKDQAQHQFDEFAKSVQSLTGQEMPMQATKADPAMTPTASSKPSVSAAPALALAIKPVDAKKESKAV